MADEDVPQGDDGHVTRRELKLELRALNQSMTLKLVGLLVVLRFDVPKEITVPAVGVAVAVALGKGALGRAASN